MDTRLTINEVAERTGLSAYTLRYYEPIGLIYTDCARRRRRAAASHLDWLALLLHLRADRSADSVHAGVRQLTERRE